MVYVVKWGARERVFRDKAEALRFFALLVTTPPYPDDVRFSREYR